MIWIISLTLAIASILLRNIFPLLGAMGFLLIPFFIEDRQYADWKEKRAEEARYLLKTGYCINYKATAEIKNPKELCARAGRVNCAACISELTGVPVKDVLESEEA